MSYAGYYIPDAYEILKIKVYGQDNITLKVFGSWNGSYLGSDSWRVNSGIVSIKDEGDNYLVSGYSGSQYLLSKHKHEISQYNSMILDDMIGELRSYGHQADIISIEEAITLIREN